MAIHKHQFKCFDKRGLLLCGFGESAARPENNEPTKPVFRSRKLKAKRKKTPASRKAAQLSLALVNKHQARDDARRNVNRTSSKLEDVKHLHKYGSGYLPPHRLGPAIDKRMRKDPKSNIGYTYEPKRKNALDEARDVRSGRAPSLFKHATSALTGKHRHTLACKIDPVTLRYSCKFP